MPESSDAQRLQELEARLNALEAASGKQDSPSAQQQSDTARTEGQAALIQAFLQGALMGNALKDATPGGAAGGEGAAPQFLSIFSCGGGGGWSPTNYDSVFWCKSRFMCNPTSLSCLC
ncbi:hypothetical protein GA0111570_108107 [Raineyella antarctica]|uniref:Uncharacterized protein n=1 Tax=Raineyella antarctica TaxID=1577474 RepID=A0A1G6HCS4_9ACTN|nr:hypothetical protein [Raineyella antarctica]SDB91735.1 hypothetical protein GA0111570_108107 [Raineyella antarctica]